MGANTSFPDKAGPSGNVRPASFSRYSHALLTPDSDQVALRDKKKKTSKFATLRKKLIRARRHSRSFDYGKLLRELTASWSIRELNALVEELEASLVLKDLTVLANLARPHANTVKDDLSLLYDYKYCTDVDLIYQGVVFPVHRAILTIRCPFFRRLLGRYPDYGSQIPVTIRTAGIDVNMFSSLLRYLYTGDLKPEATGLDNIVLMQLIQEFGSPNPLEHDLRTLLETGDHCDAVLKFAPDPDAHDSTHGEYHHPEGACHRTIMKNELRCHKAILAARSPFFRSLLLRRARSGEEATEHALQSRTTIVLDETVIPKRYARVLLHAVYLDTVDLSCIVRNSVSMCSLSEVQAMVAGKGQLTVIDEAMEIYQIGQFLDFPTLSQGCEDILVESLSVENLVSVLQWSSEAHGSEWVHRQALHFLREEFLQISHSPVLHDISKDYMLQAIRSDFLQAGEVDVLTAVLKWGEHQLVKRIEEREPNILSHTAHSVSKKGIKKRDLNDIELREILADLLPHIRTDHVIPANNETLSSVIRRGLISVPPSHMIGDDGGHSAANAWIHAKHNGMYVKPRLFTPYYEEAKALLDEQISQVQENELVRLRVVHPISAIPDTLYMVEDASLRSQPPLMPPSASTVDIIAGTIPVPDQDTLMLLQRREFELQHSKSTRRAFSLPCCDRYAAGMQIQLRVVREFDMPDSAVKLLQSSAASPLCGLAVEQQYGVAREDPSQERLSLPSAKSRSRQFQPPQAGKSHFYPARQRQPLTPTAKCRLSRQERRAPSTPVSPALSYNPIDKEPASCSDTALSDIIPDIAMATSSMNQLSLSDLDIPPPPRPIQPHDLELDLGDGSNHSGTGTMYI